jgi:hypothetical protein
MRVSTAAVCSLAVLAAQELTHGAIAHAATLSESPEPQNPVPSDKRLVVELTPTTPTVETLETVPAQSTSSAIGILARAPQPVVASAGSDSEVISAMRNPSGNATSHKVATSTVKQLETALSKPQPTIAPPEVLAIATRTIRPVATHPGVTAAPVVPIPVAEQQVAVAQPCNRSASVQLVSLRQENCLTAQVDSAPLPGGSSQNTAPQNVGTPTNQEFEELQRQLREVSTSAEDFGDVFGGSPAITVSNPSGFGADRNTAFLNFSYQARTRFGNTADGTAGIGFGIGDARRNVGLQLSYSVASFGTTRDFGTGGFNAKLHRNLGNGLSVALGWEGFVTTGEVVDFKDSVYGAVTQVIRTRPNLNDPFSRIALTAGLGNGRFRSESDIANNVGSVNVFGSVAVRVARPVSAIVEWTGQDLALGLSIAPFRNVPLVITPALRDITGAGDGTRFVLGAGIAVRF